MPSSTVRSVAAVSFVSCKENGGHTSDKQVRGGNRGTGGTHHDGREVHVEPARLGRVLLRDLLEVRLEIRSRFARARAKGRSQKPSAQTLLEKKNKKEKKKGAKKKRRATRRPDVHFFTVPTSFGRSP